MPSPIKRLMTSRDVSARYGGVSLRTLARWIKANVIPKPDRVIRRRNYWWESTLIEHERRLVAERPTAVAAISPTA